MPCMFCEENTFNSIIIDWSFCKSSLMFVPSPPEFLATTSASLCCCTGYDLTAIVELFVECRVVSFSSSPLSDGLSASARSFSAAGAESSGRGGGGWM